MKFNALTFLFLGKKIYLGCLGNTWCWNTGFIASNRTLIVGSESKASPMHCRGDRRWITFPHIAKCQDFCVSPGHPCVGQRTTQFFTEYLEFIFTGDYKQLFWTGLLYLPESSSCWMILPQILTCLTLQNLWKSLCPSPYIPHFHIFVTTVCLPVEKMSSDAMLSDHSFEVVMSSLC